MCQSNCNTKNKKGKHLSYEDRVKIGHLYNIQDKNYTEGTGMCLFFFG